MDGLALLRYEDGPERLVAEAALDRAAEIFEQRMTLAVNRAIAQAFK